MSEFVCLCRDVDTNKFSITREFLEYGESFKEKTDQRLVFLWPCFDSKKVIDLFRAHSDWLDLPVISMIGLIMEHSANKRLLDLTN